MVQGNTTVWCVLERTPRDLPALKSQVVPALLLCLNATASQCPEHDIEIAIDAKGTARRDKGEDTATQVLEDGTTSCPPSHKGYTISLEPREHTLLPGVLVPPNGHHWCWTPQVEQRSIHFGILHQVFLHREVEDDVRDVRAQQARPRRSRSGPSARARPERHSARRSTSGAASRICPGSPARTRGHCEAPHRPRPHPLQCCSQWLMDASGQL
mmetsp:Transcript_139865/g.389783  ORF Transcript_139865/g.389783 Transcript_139865/m.389783 type:complete len:213 (+) Transcript_139865:660-1298(+)